MTKKVKNLWPTLFVHISCVHVGASEYTRFTSCALTVRIVMVIADRSRSMAHLELGVTCGRRLRNNSEVDH